MHPILPSLLHITMSLSEACQSAAAAKGDTVAKLQQQIQYHLGMVYDLRYQINQCAPISRLPPEMLCRIFHFAQDACEDTLSGPQKGVNWIVVTSICRHWRNTALNDASLWARLPLRIPKWTTVMLQRSQGAHLSVSIDVSTIKASVISEVFGQAHRLTQLTIRKVFNSPSWENLSVDWGSLHVPNLAKLCLQGSGSRPESPLAEALFRGTVKLRHLEISEADIRWNSHLFKSLTTLVLDHMSSRMPNWSQLWSMLQGIPGLQSLTMRQTLPSITPETMSIICPIHLPSISVLCLDEDATKLESFFRSVLFSDCLETSRCYISVEAEQTAANICDLLSLASRVSSGACLSARARSLLIEGTLYHSEPYKISVKTANCPLDPDLNVEAHADWHEIDDIPGFKFEIWEETMRPREGDIYNEIFTGIFRTFDFRNLLELDLSCHDVPSPVTTFRDILAATYGTLPMLCSVIVGDSTASLLIDILTIRSDKQDDCDATDKSDFLSSDGLFDGSDEDSDEEFDLSPISPSSPIVFPALRSLRLFDVSFNWDEHNPSFVVKLDQLEKCLVSRSRHGVGILILVVAYCENLHSEDVEKMEDLVPEVILYEHTRRE